jgi:hypothetical protein
MNTEGAARNGAAPSVLISYFTSYGQAGNALAGRYSLACYFLRNASGVLANER